MVTGLSLSDGVRSSVIWEGLRVELVLHTKVGGGSEVDPGHDGENEFPS